MFCDLGNVNVYYEIVGEGAPVLMIHGFYPDHNYPRATFAVLDTAGHNLQIEQPQVFNALASEWLDRLQLEKRRQDVQSRSPSVK